MLGLHTLVFAGRERSDGASRCEVVEDHERCLPPNHPEPRGMNSPASAWSGILRPLSTDSAQLALPSSLVFPCPEGYLSSSFASSKTDSVKRHTKALMSPVALPPHTPGDTCCDPLCCNMFFAFNKYFFIVSCEPPCPLCWTCWEAGGGVLERISAG